MAVSASNAKNIDMCSEKCNFTQFLSHKSPYSDWIFTTKILTSKYTSLSNMQEYRNLAFKIVHFLS